jgi:hypothetical protein
LRRDAARNDRSGSSGIEGNAQRPRDIVRRAHGQDTQRDAGTGKVGNGGPDGAVTAGSNDGPIPALTPSLARPHIGCQLCNFQLLGDVQSHLLEQGAGRLGVIERFGSRAEDQRDPSVVVSRVWCAKGYHSPTTFLTPCRPSGSAADSRAATSRRHRPACLSLASA